MDCCCAMSARGEYAGKKEEEKSARRCSGAAEKPGSVTRCNLTRLFK